MQQRTVFFVSDGTGITAESLGQLLAHFPNVTFRQIRLPFTDTVEKVQIALDRISQAENTDGVRPIVVMTLAKPDLEAMLKTGNALYLDVFSSFVDPLAVELNEEPTQTSGVAHSVLGNSYHERIDAINFTLNHDDGMTDYGLSEAEVILVGVSRCGKTPTSLYLAMQFGIKAANYPLIPEDFERGKLPSSLPEFREKLFGLTITPERLSEIRHERRAGSKYASIENCRYEVNEAELMMKREGIRSLSSTTKSIEEISTTILQEIKPDRREY